MAGVRGIGTNDGNSIGLKDFDKVIKELDRLPKEFSLARRKGVLKVSMKPFIEDAKQNAPVEDGDLVLSINSKWHKGRLYGGIIFKNIVKGVGKIDAYYAKFIEFGWNHIGWPYRQKKLRRDGAITTKVVADPFLRQAWDRNKNKIDLNVKKIVDRRIKAWKKRQGMT